MVKRDLLSLAKKERNVLGQNTLLNTLKFTFAFIMNKDKGNWNMGQPA